MSVTGPKKLTRVMDGLFARFDYDALLVLVVEPDDVGQLLPGARIGFLLA